MRKKLFKLFLALVIIIAVVVLVVFLTKNNGTKASYYTNITKLNYEIKDENDNIVELVNVASADMLNIIKNNNLEMKVEEAFLSLFTEELEMYSLVNEEIKAYGNFNLKSSSSAHVKKMNTNFKKLVNAYKDGYEYLKDTYFKIANGNYEHIETMQAYIKNFVIIFKDSAKYLNDFYYNAGVSYAIGTRNISDINNLYKLNVVYYVELTNQYFTKLLNDEEPVIKYKELAMERANIIKEKTQSQYDKYINNKPQLDYIVKNFKLLKGEELASRYVEGGLGEYLEGIDGDTAKVTNNNFVKYVMEVEVN